MAQGNLSACLLVTLAYEGGLSMIRSDSGNWTGGKVGVGLLRGTNFGIAASAHLTLAITTLTKADAGAIYERDYWSPAGCKALPAGLDLSHFDGTVNSGLMRSSRWLARAGSGATADRIRAYNDARLSFDQALRNWRTFGKAWGARCAGIEAKSLRMALGAGSDANGLLTKRAERHARAAVIGTTATHAGTVSAAIVATHAVTGSHFLVMVCIGLLCLCALTGFTFAAWRNGIRAAAFAHEAATPSSTKGN